MALSDIPSLLPLPLPLSPTTSLLILLTLPLLTVLLRSLHRLSHIPGPPSFHLSSLLLTYHSYLGDEATTVHRIHTHYGPIVRIAPNAIDVADGDALHPIYIAHGGMRKPVFYLNFRVNGHTTVFSEIEPGERAPRAKAVMGCFSQGNLRQGRGKVYGVVGRWTEVLRMSREKGEVDLLGVCRSLAADAVGVYLFGAEFGALGVERERLEGEEKGRGKGGKGHVERADGMMDAFDSIGRYWYLPPWIYGVLEWVRVRYFADEALFRTFDVMERYTNKVVEAALTEKQELAGTYQGRLLQAGFSESETTAQTQDALFAGVDTTGMNLAIIVWYLTKYPDKYEALKKELQEANPTEDEVQNLPYLKAVVQEGLRISSANPTRFARVTPPSGFTFKGTFIPAGVEVSCSPFELHNNPEVFDNPREFRPERWLNASKEMNRDWIPFSVGPRKCIAWNLALMELHCAVHKVAEEDLLAGARCVKDKIELLEWLNSKVVGGTIDISWDRS